jgi:hypothetical protein
MPLTAVQINQLYIFTRQHFVEWYDLQSELVDHLANAIEAQMKENTALTFDEALNVEFQKFGVFGFMDVVENRQAVLKKKYNSLVWTHFKGFFSIPKIIFTTAVTATLYNLIKLDFYSKWIFLGIYVILIGTAFYYMIENRKNRKQKTVLGQKRWLFEEIINKYGDFSAALIVPLNIFIQLLNHSNVILSNNYWILGLSSFLVVIAISIFIIFVIIPSKVEEYLLATYPEYKLEKL